jgi:hypothetical protein
MLLALLSKIRLGCSCSIESKHSSLLGQKDSLQKKFYNNGGKSCQKKELRFVYNIDANVMSWHFKSGKGARPSHSVSFLKVYEDKKMRFERFGWKFFHLLRRRLEERGEKPAPARPDGVGLDRFGFRRLDLAPRIRSRGLWFLSEGVRHPKYAGVAANPGSQDGKLGQMLSNFLRPWFKQ